MSGLPFGGVLASSLMIAWATEVASFFLSRGLAFALLALIQVLPEFAVEGVVTWNAAHGDGTLDLVTANFTGANRLLVGLFLPMVFFIHYYKTRRATGEIVGEVALPTTSSLEIIALLIPTLYSFFFALRASISLVDAGVLIGMYVIYLLLAYRLPPEEESPDTLPPVPRYIMGRTARLRFTLMALLFVGGGALLFLSVEPFYHNTLEIAALLGISAYFLLQWIAPLLSEAPELITVAYWGKTGRAQLGVTNLVSSKINQWTLLIAMIPIIYFFALREQGLPTHALGLTDHQQVEVLITAAQGLFAVACLMTLRFRWWQAWALAVLWVVQVADPLFDPFLVGWLPSPFPPSLDSGALVREWFTVIYLALTVFVLVKYRRNLAVFAGLRQTWREHIRPGAHADEPSP